MKVKLTLQSTEIKPNEFNLSKLPAKIGRGKEATLRLIHPQVSRLHCELFEEAGELHVRDLASLNGTFVDEERVDDFVPIPSGAKLMLGSIEFQVLCGDDVDRLPPPGDAGVASDAAQPAEAGEPIEELEMADDQDEAGAAPADDTGTVDLDWLLAPDGASGAAVSSPAATNSQAAKNSPAAKPQPAAKPAQAVQPPAAMPKPAAPKPAAPKPAATEPLEPPAEQAPAANAEAEDLDDFFKSIM
jgi:hypothetical protein